MRIFDIGTNRGHFTDEYLESYPKAEIVCIEANPYLCEWLAQKYINVPNEKVYHYLLSDESNKLIDFYINNECGIFYNILCN